MKRFNVITLLAGLLISASAHADITGMLTHKVKDKLIEQGVLKLQEDHPLARANTRKDCAALTGFGAPVFKRPMSGDEMQIVCRAGYVLQHSTQTKGAVWVAEYLRPEAVFGDEPRSNDFKPDPAVPTRARATLGDYKGSGYDRGHYAPAADFSRDAEQMADSFFLSNMGPQEPTVNRGVWAEIEKFARKRASRSEKGLYVVTGPVFALGNGSYVATKTAPACQSKFIEQTCNRTFEKAYATIGRKAVFVPDAYFKVIIDAANGSTWAFMVPNMQMPKSYNMRIDPWLYSVKEVEEKTGLTFFPALPANVREKAISTFPTLGRPRGE